MDFQRRLFSETGYFTRGIGGEEASISFHPPRRLPAGCALQARRTPHISPNPHLCGYPESHELHPAAKRGHPAARMQAVGVQAPGWGFAHPHPG